MFQINIMDDLAGLLSVGVARMQTARTTRFVRIAVDPELNTLSTNFALFHQLKSVQPHALRSALAVQ